MKKNLKKSVIEMTVGLSSGTVSDACVLYYTRSFTGMLLWLQSGAEWKNMF